MRVSGIGEGYCFSVPLGHPWLVPRFIPGASHKKTIPPPQSPVEFTVLFELQVPLLSQEKSEKTYSHSLGSYF